MRHVLIFLGLAAGIGACGESHTEDPGTADANVGRDAAADVSARDATVGTDADLPDGNLAPDAARPDARFPDAAPPDGTTPDGGELGVDCMGTRCAPGQQCCISGGAGGATATCIAAGDGCMGTATDCDGPEDCGAGNVCCGQQAGGGISVSCVPTAMCESGGFTQFQLCHVAADCSNGTDMCCPFSLFGFSGAICSPMCFGF
ncbi:MAG: hypothetical protein AAGF12_11260 [Myxococcota bacterium]